MRDTPDASTILYLPQQACCKNKSPNLIKHKWKHFKYRRKSTGPSELTHADQTRTFSDSHLMFLFFEGKMTLVHNCWGWGWKKKERHQCQPFLNEGFPPQLPPVSQDGGNWDLQCAVAGYLTVALLAALLMAGLVKGLFGLSQSLICTLHNYAGFTVLSNCNSN